MKKRHCKSTVPFLFFMQVITDRGEENALLWQVYGFCFCEINIVSCTLGK